MTDAPVLAVPATAARRPRRRWPLVLVVLAIVLVVAVLALRVALRPEHVTGLLLRQVGKTLGLEITASGVGEYRLRGTPTLVVRGVVARAPGAATPLLRADRVLLSLPWSTLRNRGRELEITRVELDAPVLDVGALRAWLASRPPTDTPLPMLGKGLLLVDGRVIGAGWSLEGLDLSLPELHARRPLDATVSGRFASPGLRGSFALALAMSRPANGAGVAIIGPLDIRHDDWRLQARVRLSGPLRVDHGAISVLPARLATTARYVAGETDLPFVLGVSGPLRHAAATTTLGPAGIALRGEGMVPTLDTQAIVALGKRLVLRLQGRIAAWPEAWPALPPPIGQSSSALPFALAYVGKPDLSDVATLHLERDRTIVDASFRLAAVTGWIDAPLAGTPLPPLDGRVTSPRIDMAGAQLEGVEVVLDDPDVSALAP